MLFRSLFHSLLQDELILKNHSSMNKTSFYKNRPRTCHPPPPPRTANVEKNTYGLKHERASHWAGGLRSQWSALSHRKLSAFQFQSMTVCLQLLVLKATQDHVIVGAGLATGIIQTRVRKLTLAQRSPIRQECPFIKGDPMTFWGLSENAEKQGGKRWKVKC